mgnify:CR=1 FL=1
MVGNYGVSCSTWIEQTVLEAFHIILLRKSPQTGWGEAAEKREAPLSPSICESWMFKIKGRRQLLSNDAFGSFHDALEVVRRYVVLVTSVLIIHHFESHSPGEPKGRLRVTVRGSCWDKPQQEWV